MGQGGYVTLVNATEYDWRRTYQDQQNMKTWDFPSRIPKGTSVSRYVEWDRAQPSRPEAYGFANYTLDVPGQHYFMVHASDNAGFDIRIEFVNMQTPAGTIIDLGWKHDGYVNFVLAGKLGAFTSNGGRADRWMQDNLGLLGDRTLRQLCIPGSHDAGMSVLNAGTGGANACNTLTQSVSIGEQLSLGARYFDIRPVITANLYRTGHYSQAAGMWHGANGQDLPSIVNEINDFTQDRQELVILKLSHDLNTDLGRLDYAPLTQDNWDYLLGYLAGSLRNLFTVPDPARGVDLSRLTLREFVGGGRSAVVVIVEPSDSTINFEAHENRGFYPLCAFHVFDEFSNTTSLDTMRDDQVAKMRKIRRSPDSRLFVLSWTLTWKGGWCIHSLADLANPQLYAQLLNHCTADCYPNILYIDYVQSPEIAAMAVAVSRLSLP